ncbi:hypothetical protein DID88_000703 [Monilinia fructigena]|uniref:Uncharacterized protein n=1 Tax=Monilinia fructigena TaxID=38457 RepID=A0A395IIC6_9HELO|nr:hypothetical protein DID88_000703 [Monilinia fructigena]
MRGCVKYLSTQTQYPPFPSATHLEAAANIEVVTPETLRDYLGSNLILSENEWLNIVALYTTQACAKLETSDLQSPFEQSKDAKREDIFERLRLEELLLAGPCGFYSERDQRALAADRRSDENALVVHMLSKSMDPDERVIMFRALDRGVSLQRIFQVTRNWEDALYAERQRGGLAWTPVVIKRYAELLEEMFSAEQVEESVDL